MFDISKATFELQLATMYAEDLYVEYAPILGLTTPWPLLSKEDKEVWYSVARQAVRERPFKA